MELVKPKRVLCKRSLIIGEPYYWDETVFPAVKRERDNRMLVKGNWYKVVHNPNDSCNEKNKTFSIIDNQGHMHLHYMYTEEERINNKQYWSSFGVDNYGPRDYSKWFYTPEELAKKKLRELSRGILPEPEPRENLFPAI